MLFIILLLFQVAASIVNVGLTCTFLVCVIYDYFFVSTFIQLSMHFENKTPRILGQLNFITCGMNLCSLLFNCERDRF